MKEKLAMFDMDGTLYDTVDSNYYAYKEAVEQFGFTLEHDFFEFVCYGHNYKNFVPMIVKESLKGSDQDVDVVLTDEIVEKIHDAKLECYTKYFDKIRLNDGLINLIKRIKYNTYVALVTTGSSKNVHEILEFFHHEDLFDEVFTQDDVENQKPDPECFVNAMKKFKMDPKDSFIYEDSDVGLRAAYKSGANVIKVGKF
ncbi:MAG: HAD family phosphatase [Eubacterium sp.]|nr:HAD family phosphatase [Eubacterium sp.]